jgi:hypothetical protein
MIKIKIVYYLCRLWFNNPRLRFLQLIEGVLPNTDTDRIRFYINDEEFLEMLRFVCKKGF